MHHHPIGVGVQGLADAFMALHMSFDSQEAKELNIKVFETIYHATLEASSEIAEWEGPYETWMGSPAQQGQLYNIYTHCILTGEFQVVCPWLLCELVTLGLWDDNMKNMIIAHNGSMQNIPSIPTDVKAIYKTIWEICRRSQSLNVHLASPTMGQLTSMHFYGWKKGLKTGMYYLRTRPVVQAIQFTVDQGLLKEAKKQWAAGAKAALAAAAAATATATPAAGRPLARTTGIPLYPITSKASLISILLLSPPRNLNPFLSTKTTKPVSIWMSMRVGTLA
ncbi:hypothetical protein CPB84DRAFT_1750324 [Gymnopilus junonius]|uniref:Ribonucleotide reductase large subunit C-terminal domain-containing protein n=1 Tax=Gymnopilus junonius TaxID=109634 RepID=A0A9P5TJG8_GYMJU|nr:hypothetical protein CPB84DRAFT_1750324 [Gymnopilus junonius]